MSIIDGVANKSGLKNATCKRTLKDKKSMNNWIKFFREGNQGTVTNQTELCNNVSFETKKLSFQWQPVIPYHSYIYSAHIDNRDNRKMIKVFTIIEEKVQEYFKLYCYIWYRNTQHAAVVKAEAEPKAGGGSYKSVI